MTDYRQIHYYLDDFGALWRGPVSPGENLHYAIFEGHTLWGKEIWDLHQAAPEPTWEEIPVPRARKIIKMFWHDALERLEKGLGYK